MKELSENTIKTYSSDFKQYSKFCSENKLHEIHKTETILKFIEAVHNGYPGGIKKKRQILKMKIRGIEYTGELKLDKKLVSDFFKNKLNN